MNERDTKTGKVVELKSAEPVKSGLTPGAADKIGYTVIEITPEMVGRKIAVFTAIQTKTPSQKISKKKQGFIKSVQKDGGIAAITNALENWPEIVEDFINPQEEVEELQK